MFGIGMTELLIILVVALLVLGPAKLPGVARSIGKGMRELRRASDDLRSSIMFDDDEPQRRYAPPPAAHQPPASEAEKITSSDIPPHIHSSLAAGSVAAATGDGPVPRDESGPAEAAPASAPPGPDAPAADAPVAAAPVADAPVTDAPKATPKAEQEAGK